MTKNVIIILMKNTNKKLFSTILLTILMANFLFFPINILAEEEASGGDTTQLEQEITDMQKKMDALQEKINEYNKNISNQKKQSLSLSGQVSILSNEINKIQSEIELKENEITTTQLEISVTQEKIQNSETDIATSKEYLKAFLQKINRLDKQNSLTLLLSVENFSDYYNHLHALNILQSGATQNLNGLKTFKAELETHITQLDEKKESLETLKSELENKKSSLDSRSYAKTSLLRESRNSENRFQSLVNQLKAEQSEINADIIALEKKLRGTLDPSRLDSISASGFIWPVLNRGITATFHDPDYPFRYLFEHPAIDIKSSQGSPIKAPASGYVAKVKINGTAYGYIMLIHSSGFATVFGHTSKSYVNADEYVAQGEIIGLSGGMPGTPGAGRLSTGPHLHFEIRKNGIPVNPLNYLP